MRQSAQSILTGRKPRFPRPLRRSALARQPIIEMPCVQLQAAIERKPAAHAERHHFQHLRHAALQRVGALEPGPSDRACRRGRACDAARHATSYRKLVRRRTAQQRSRRRTRRGKTHRSLATRLSRHRPAKTGLAHLLLEARMRTAQCADGQHRAGGPQRQSPAQTLQIRKACARLRTAFRPPAIGRAGPCRAGSANRSRARPAHARARRRA